MNTYKSPNPGIWNGRTSGQGLYLHEIVKCIDFETLSSFASTERIALLGYACDEGVRRNQGRIGAAEGPDAIRGELGKLPNPLNPNTTFLDMGNVICLDGNMEAAQNALSQKVALLLERKCFPILLGGGHDMAYGHYKGIKQYLGKDKSIGIFNFDAHFDLRNNKTGNNSGTPFYQIAQDCRAEGETFPYFCLGIRRDANDQALFGTASELGVHYLENREFSIGNAKQVVRKVLEFLGEVDHVYITIDLDGFSSAYAPGVSAASPLGFAPSIVLETLQMIMDSRKLVSLDLAEMNPRFDRDNQTAKLAASLVHFVMLSSA